MLKYLIICPLVFVAGFIDAIAGGGGLISLPAYLIAGMPAINCVATNKMSSCMGTAVATGKYAHSGFIPWKQALLCVPCAIVGSACGANIALLLHDNVFKMIMLVILPATGIYVLTRKNLVSEKEPYKERKTTVISMVLALLIGIYDGFYGPGTGTFLILLLTGLARMQLTSANGVTKVINLTTNVAALTVYLLHGQVILPLGLIAGVFGIAGNYLGAGRFTKGGTKLMKRVMIVVLVIFFVKVLLELLGVI